MFVHVSADGHNVSLVDKLVPRRPAETAEGIFSHIEWISLNSQGYVSFHLPLLVQGTTHRGK